MLSFATTPARELGLFSLNVSLMLVEVGPPIGSRKCSNTKLFAVAVLSDYRLKVVSGRGTHRSTSRLNATPPFVRALLCLYRDPHAVAGFSSVVSAPNAHLVASRTSLSYILLVY